MKNLVKDTSILKLLRPIHFCFRIFPVRNNKIIFNNFHGKGFGDNPRYIAEALMDDKNLDLVWIVNNKKDTSIPSKIRTVNKKSLKCLYELATARVWVSNVRLYSFISKRRKQFYIQTWHGGLGLKKIERQAEASLNRFYIDSAKNDSNMADVMISNCRYRTNQYRKYFWYQGKIIEAGLPKNDLFFSSDKDLIKKKVHESLGVSENEKIVLYAPTYRKYSYNYNAVSENPYFKNVNDYRLVIRTHPNVKPTDRLDAINASNYPDISELLIASDILITDYSSIMFDYANLGRPIILFVDDYEKYYEGRGLNIDIKDLPFRKASSNEDLSKIMINLNYSEEKERIKSYLEENIVFDDGRASERIAKIIKDEMGSLDE